MSTTISYKHSFSSATISPVPSFVSYSRIHHRVLYALRTASLHPSRTSAHCAHCFFLRRCSRSSFKSSAAQCLYSHPHACACHNGLHITGIKARTRVRPFTNVPSVLASAQPVPSTWPQDILHSTIADDMRPLFLS
jgi:hypothetical protein